MNSREIYVSIADTPFKNIQKSDFFGKIFLCQLCFRAGKAGKKRLSIGLHLHLTFGIFLFAAELLCAKIPQKLLMLDIWLWKYGFGYMDLK